MSKQNTTYRVRLFQKGLNFTIPSEVKSFRNYNPGDKLLPALLWYHIKEKMGRNGLPKDSGFLPEPDNEYEIIRIHYDSSNSDQISIRASLREGAIHVSMYDEYQNELTGPAEKTFDKTPSQGEIFDWLAGIQTNSGVDYIINACAKDQYLRGNLHFIHFESSLYPNLNALLVQYFEKMNQYRKPVVE